MIIDFLRLRQHNVKQKNKQKQSKSTQKQASTQPATNMKARIPESACARMQVCMCASVCARVGVRLSGEARLEVRRRSHGGRKAVDALVAPEPVPTLPPERTEVRG